MGQSFHCPAVQGNLHSINERCPSGGFSPIFLARCIRQLFIKNYLYKSHYSKLLSDSWVQRKTKLQLSLSSFDIFFCFSWKHLGQQGGATRRFVAVEDRSGRCSLSASSLWEWSTHSLSQQQLLKFLARCQQVAGCENKPHPLTISKRKEIKTLCLSYKPEPSHARRAEWTALKIFWS